MASKNSIPLQISGHHILPLSLSPLPSFPNSATHYLYVSNHQPKNPTPTAPRSLFLVNVPFDATDVHIRHLLSTQLSLPSGRIEDILFEGEEKKAHQPNEALIAHPSDVKKSKKRKRSAVERSADEAENAKLPATWDRKLYGVGDTAVVTLVDRASADAVIKAIKTVRKQNRQLTWGEGIETALPILGLARYLNHHKLRYPDKTQLLQCVNNFMTAFAAQEASRAKLQARQRQEPDEDGFVMVTRGGRKGPARLDVAQEQADRQKKRQKGLEDFYRFQTREKNKAKAGELVRKFEEDKEKVRMMRERKQKFKPE